MNILRNAAEPACDARVIAVAGGKGGAGASTVAALLARSAADDGMDTLLVEARAPATLHLGFGCNAFATAATVWPGLHLISAPADLPGPADTAARRARNRGLRDCFAPFDFICVDVGSGLDAVLAARDVGAAFVLVVTTADRIGLAAAHAFIKAVAAHCPQAHIAACANNVDAAAGERALGVLAAGARRFLDVRIDTVGSLPADLRLSADSGAQPLLDLPLDSPLTRAVRFARECVRPREDRLLGVLP
jgi:MinD-like ATPase involved in chromosome partitioning or flagellar assembly